jgi:transcriptional regulator with XRE-family HTH domain
MTSDEIKLELYRLRLRTGKTKSDIAADLGVSPTTVYQVVRRGTKSTRIMKHIAALLGLPLLKVWPELAECGATGGRTCAPRSLASRRS